MQAAGGAVMAAEALQQASHPSGAETATNQTDTVAHIQQETETTHDTQMAAPPEAQVTKVTVPIERAGADQQSQAFDVTKAIGVVDAAVPHGHFHQVGLLCMHYCLNVAAFQFPLGCFA